MRPFNLSNEVLPMVAEPLPYTQSGNVRLFLKSTPEIELKWHWDELDRTITTICDNTWLFQFDNELPVKMINGESFYIPAGALHRLIKGNEDLWIKILES